MITTTLKHLRTPALAAALAAAALAPAALAGQASATRPLPFAPGEACVYRASGPLGRIGSGTMSVADAGTTAGRRTWLLRFDFRGRMGPMTAEDHTRSWFDPRALASVRYSKRERSPLTSTDQDVTMDLTAGRWREPDGRSGPLASEAPLDELSFLYYLRTLRWRRARRTPSRGITRWTAIRWGCAWWSGAGCGCPPASSTRWWWRCACAIPSDTATRVWCAST
jgi:hypothetical protein